MTLAQLHANLTNIHDELLASARDAANCNPEKLIRISDTAMHLHKHGTDPEVRVLAAFALIGMIETMWSLTAPVS